LPFFATWAFYALYTHYHEKYENNKLGESISKHLTFLT